MSSPVTPAGKIKTFVLRDEFVAGAFSRTGRSRAW